MFWIPNKVSDFLTIIASKSLPVIADLHHFHITNCCFLILVFIALDIKQYW